MRTWYNSWLLLLAVPFLLIATENGDSAKGKEVYTKRCVICHGPSGEGKEAIEKAFNVKMVSLYDPEVQSKDDAVLKKGILEGTGKMKPVKITDQEAEDAIAYLRTLKK